MHFAASRRGNREIPIPLEFHGCRRSRLHRSQKYPPITGREFVGIIGVKELPG
jgi:hypothetical protein